MTTRNEIRATALCECRDMLSIMEYLMSQVDTLTEYEETGFMDTWEILNVFNPYAAGGAYQPYDWRMV